MAWNLKQKAQDHIVSIGLGLIVLLLLIVWQAVPSSVWGKVSEATPKRALWALLGLAGITICLLGGALIDLKRKARLIAANPPKSFRMYGVHWDKEANPLCPVCECLMPIHHQEGANHEIDVLWCPRCKTLFSLWDDNGERVSLEIAKRFINFILH